MMWSQLSMASVFGPVYLADLRALSRQLRVRAAGMVREIEASPEPDGVFKRHAPAPFKAGTTSLLRRVLRVATQSTAMVYDSIAFR